MTNETDNSPDLKTSVSLDADAGDDRPDEMSLLKERARSMGVNFSPNIGVDTLRERVKNAIEGRGPVEETQIDASKLGQTESPAMVEQSRKAKVRQDMKKEHMALIRVSVANLDPSKNDIAGEFHTVVNKYLGVVKRFIPYGEATENGWHMEKILYEQLKSKRFLQKKTKRDSRNPGQIIVETRWVPEFALTVMDPLTSAEMKSLAASQAAAGGLSE